MDILEKIKSYKLVEAQKAEEILSQADVDYQIEKNADSPRGFYKALLRKKQQGEFGIIAEIKKASPSKGLIRNDFNPEALAVDYQAGGAACLSILTDKPSFMGDDSYLKLARDKVLLPCLRKEFIFTPYQVAQSRLLGADCILLIMACLKDEQAKKLEKIAFDYKMDVLIEVHDEHELERALTHLSSPMIGINNRNLKTFATDIHTSLRLAELIPNDRLVISESGLYTKADLLLMQDSNITSFLIGESLMRQKNVEKALQDLLVKS